MCRPVGSVRPRLMERFADLWPRRLAMVVAPAGSGKTTLLAQVAKAADVPVAWYAAEDMYTHPDDLLVHLRGAFAAAVGGWPESDRWTSVRQAVTALERLGPDPMLLVVDDLHRIEGTEAEAVLERLVDHAPPALAVVAASRAAPAWNLSRRRVTGQVIEISGEDLRFRSWEVERLFRGHYGAVLDPADLAALTRHTEGWAAALQLFHLAARRKSPVERHRLVTSMGSHLRLVREYLVRNVVEELPAELHAFLIETCVLGRLRADLCDELRERPGSHVLLAELERRQLASWSDDGGGWFRLHEVLRLHLETSYLQATHEAVFRARYRCAGSLLESAGALSDALRAYCRAEDWDAAGRLLGHKGEELARGAPKWLEGVSPALLHHDPWLLLAEARRQRAAGQWASASETYQRAERAMPRADAAELCRRERAALVAWLHPGAVRLGDWSGALREAMNANPMDIHLRWSTSSDVTMMLVAGLAALGAGCPALAVPALAGVVDHPRAGPVEVAAARLGMAGAALLSGQEPQSIDEAAETLEVLGIGGLTRIATALRTSAAEGDGGSGEMAALAAACREDGDFWGEGIVDFLHGWRLLGLDRPADAAQCFEAVAHRFAVLGGGILEALAAGFRALAHARCGEPGGFTEARSAEAAARALGSPGAEAVAVEAMSLSDDAPGDLASKGALLARACGLVVPGCPQGRRPLAVGATEDQPPVAVRCFGGFVLTLRGHPVELGHLKPRARKVLRYLGMHCPEWIHREVLIEAVWPNADPVSGARNLQVVVSTLRHALEPSAARGQSLIARQGAAYRLALPPGAWVDHVAVDQAAARGRAARAAGSRTEAEAAFREVLDVASGPLLPEDGPEDWVVVRRNHYQSEVASAAEALAEILVQNGAAADAVAACRRGLAVDRCSDRLWRLLVRTSETMGDLAASAQARREYEGVLAELGVQ